MNGTCTAQFNWSPPPCGHGEGPKGQISLNFNNKVNFKGVLNQTLCVFSQKKDIIHIRRDLHSAGWDLGLLEEGSSITFSEHGHVAYQIKGDDQ